MTEGRHARDQVGTATGRKQFERPNQPFQVRSSGNNPIKLFSGGAPWRESSGFVMIRGTLRFWWKRPEEIYRGAAGWRHGCDGQQRTLSAVWRPALQQGRVRLTDGPAIWPGTGHHWFLLEFQCCHMLPHRPFPFRMSPLGSSPVTT